MARCKYQVDGYAHNSYKRLNTREEIEENYLQFLMEVPQEVDHDQEDALVLIQ
jgi:viroplasmin and RNaseH domain-containing protein